MNSLRNIKSWGFVLLAIWLILYGALPLLHISIPATILEVLAIAAGILILLNR